MSDNDWSRQIAPTVRTQQFIVAAMCAGCVMFLVIALAVGGERGEGTPVLTFAALAFAGSAIGTRQIVIGAIAAAGRRGIIRGEPFEAPAGVRLPADALSGEDAPRWRLLMTFATRNIVACALLEGPAFFLIIAYMLERSPLALGGAVALIVALLLHTPTRSGVVRWVERQLRLIEEERQLRNLRGDTNRH